MVEILYINQLFTAGMVFSSIAFTLSVGFVTANKLDLLPAYFSRSRDILEVIILIGICTDAALMMLVLGWSINIILYILLIGIVALLVASRALQNWTVAGFSLFMTYVLLEFFGLLWSVSFIATSPVSPLTRFLMFSGYFFVILIFIIGLAQNYEQWEVLCRKKWKRPHNLLPDSIREHYPKISLHVPICSEPPDVVIATLNAAARIQYPNFEVLVIDNNTKDVQLWRPVAKHCQRLGKRFRFFHLDHCPGAKAGALNFAIQHSAKDTEIIGLIDSDYQVEPDFLSALISHFDNPKIGFVQTPQAYREWEGRPYLRMCKWEYKLVFATTLISRNERNSALTVGTMGLIRRQALEDAGGWAEWCVTEDSELAVRIHAKGYSSLYINKIFGRGLIPETFEGYKRQRFRWTYGPMQEFKRHFPLFLPAPFARPSALSGAQKIHHLTHGLSSLKIGLTFLLKLLGLAVGISIYLHHETIELPSAVWQSALVGLVGWFLLRWRLFHKAVGCSFWEMVGATFAATALTHTTIVASLSGLFTSQIPWRRTNKFKALPNILRTLHAVKNELLIGMIILIIGGSVLANTQPSGFMMLLLIGLLMQSAEYLAAPIMALLAEKDIQSNKEIDIIPNQES